MTTWGFIGSGNIGRTVARLAVAAGHDVVMSNSRGPQTLGEVVGDLGDHARAASATQAAQVGDVVVVTIPLKNYRDVPVEQLAGKIVIDTMNYYSQRDGQIAALDSQATTPAAASDRSALAIAGDDAVAKRRATELFGEIGNDTVDLGPLLEGWRIQPGTLAYGLMYAADEQDWTAGARPADVAEVRLRAAAAQRVQSG